MQLTAPKENRHWHLSIWYKVLLVAASAAPAAGPSLPRNYHIFQLHPKALQGASQRLTVNRDEARDVEPVEAASN